MKKFTIYSLMLASVYCLSLLSADATGTRPQHSKRMPKPNMISFKNPQVPPHIMGVPFYIEDFSAGFPFGWMSNDLDTSGLNWSWTLTGSTGFQADPICAPASFGNGWMILDNDGNFGVGLSHTELVTALIDCQGHSNVHISWYEFFRQYNNSLGIVSISTDSVNWTEIHHAETGLNDDDYTTCPVFVDLDITGYAAGSDTLYVKFDWQATTGTGYWWQVDDLWLYENAAADGGVTSVDAPLSNCAGLSCTEPVTVTISNYGGADIIPPYDLFLMVDGIVVGSETNTMDTIFVGSSIPYTFTTLFANVCAAGDHSISAWTGVSADADNMNDSASSTLFTGANVVRWTTPYTNGFEVGTDNMAGWNTEDANSDLNVWFMTNSAIPNTGAYNAIYFGEYPAQTSADDYLFTPCMDLDTMPYQLDFFYRQFSTLYQGVLDVKLYSAQSSASAVQTLIDTFSVTELLYLPSSTVFSAPSAGIYYIGFHVINVDTNSCAMLIDDINIHTAQDSVLWTGVHQNAAARAISIYPNPSTGIIRVTNSSKSDKDFAMTVTNMLGEVVYHNKFNNLSSEIVDLSALSSGVYSVEMKSANNNIHQSIIISGK